MDLKKHERARTRKLPFPRQLSKNWSLMSDRTPLSWIKKLPKLINYSDGQMISDKDVELLVKAKIDGNIFSAIDALGANNKKEAMKLLHDNLEKGEDPFYIFSMIVYQFRNMIKIADLKEREWPVNMKLRGHDREPDFALVRFLENKSPSTCSRFPNPKCTHRSRRRS